MEEADFIWYHRDDLGWQWQPILDAFKGQFPDSSTTRDVSGIQCKYYRHLEGQGLPQVRQRRTAPAEEYYMRAFTERRYPWMG